MNTSPTKYRGMEQYKILKQHLNLLKNDGNLANRNREINCSTGFKTLLCTIKLSLSFIEEYYNFLLIFN